MAAKGYHRGHAMSFVDGAWRYDDTGTLVSESPDRDCGSCGMASTAEGHDGCLGTLPGVVNACCGHGDKHEGAYVVYADGRTLRGAEAAELFTKLATPVVTEKEPE